MTNAPSSTASLEERLKPHRAVEEYFARSGRTLRKGKFRLWFNERIKPWLIRSALRVLGLYRRGQRNALQVQVKRLEFSFPLLPSAFDGFSLLHISDFHIDKLDPLPERIASVLRSVKADFCVLTGDYRYEIRGDCSEVYPRMALVLRNISARYGIWGILGNHDAAEIAVHLEEMGVRMLVNDAAPIEVGTERIWLLGIDDPFDYRCDDLPAALRPVPPGEFKILLAHTPVLYAQAEQAGIDLYLCGHTHAGQIRLPKVGALKKNGDFPRAFVQDRWSYGRMQGYTSWGVGCSTLPVRFNCPPEVTLITLRRGTERMNSR